MIRSTKWKYHSSTSAYNALAVDNNGTWADAWQFGKPDDDTWNLTGASFELDIQRDPYDAQPLLSCSTTNGRIIIDDDIQRVIHMNVTPEDLQSHLTPGIYVYDLVLTEASGIRTPLMHGTFELTQGVTYP